MSALQKQTWQIFLPFAQLQNLKIEAVSALPMKNFVVILQPFLRYIPFFRRKNDEIFFTIINKP